jgi:hypothetical protein
MIFVLAPPLATDRFIGSYRIGRGSRAGRWVDGENCLRAAKEWWGVHQRVKGLGVRDLLRRHAHM